MINVAIPAVADPSKRLEFEKHPLLFLRECFPSRFHLDFTSKQESMIETILGCAQMGFPYEFHYRRGSGATSIAIGTAIYGLLHGLFRYPVVLSETSSDAELFIDAVKHELRNNADLARYYPEVCVPLRAMQDCPPHDRFVCVDQQPIEVNWGKKLISLPRVPRTYGDRASGSALYASSFGSSWLGLSYRGMRPDFVLVDNLTSADRRRHGGYLLRRLQSLGSVRRPNGVVVLSSFEGAAGAGAP